MSKKRQSRRSRRSSQSTTGGARARYESEFNPDYSQTIKDLKRIGILASSFFGILIVLAIFLR